MTPRPGRSTCFISDSLDGLIVNQDTLSGVNSFLGSTPHFTAVSALAGPSGEANLGSVTLDVTTEAAGPHTLTIIATQTGLNFPAVSTQTSFTYNGLEGAPRPNTDTMSVNGASIVSHTFPAAVGVDAFGPIAGVVPPSPAGRMPSGCVGIGTSENSVAKNGNRSARGIA